MLMAEENIQYASADTPKGRPSGVAPIFTSVGKKEKHKMHWSLPRLLTLSRTNAIFTMTLMFT